MAEFQEVIKQKERMCRESNCCDCPIDGYFDSCVNINAKNAAKYEELVMQWARENPEKEYPTWIDWQQKMFPNATNAICPKEYMSKEEAHCCGHTCYDCRRQQIPEEIAVKLGLKKE